MRASALKLFGVGVALGLSALFILAVGNREPVGLAQADCTVTVQPGQSIQRAIDGAPSGAVICLVAGTFEENIVIEKSLTLRGEREETVIDGVREGYPVVWVRTPEQAQAVVQLEGLGITGAKGGCADIDKGICAHGVLLQGTAQATISGSTVSGNRDGIGLVGSAKITIERSTLQGNGTHLDYCNKPEYICNGLAVWGEAVAELRDSRIIENTDWGVAAWLKKCGYDEDDFTGKVVFEGTNTIEGNSRSNNQKGKGNPGWPGPPMPDGQVCLP